MSQALHFDDKPDTALLSFHDVSTLTKWKRTKIHCDVKRGTFPAPLKIGRNRNVDRTTAACPWGNTR